MKKILLLSWMLLFAATINAQEIYNSSGRKTPQKPAKPKGFNRDNLMLGGDFRFVGGSGFLSLGVAPMVGYKLFNNFYGGIRLGYSYDRQKIDPYYLPAGVDKNVFNFNSYTAGIWCRYLIFESIYLHAETEYNYYDNYFYDDYSGVMVKKYVGAQSVLLGLGLKQPITDRVSINSTILYDIIGNVNSYYANKGGFDFRIGVLVGF